MTPEVELVVPEAGGADLVETRQVRISLTEGRVVGRTAQREVAVPAADVRRVVWLDAEQTRALLPGSRGVGPWASLTPSLGSVALLTDTGPALTFLVSDFSAADGQVQDHLDASGATALAAALGLPVETDPTIALSPGAVRSVLVAPRRPRTRALAPLLALLTAAAGAAAFLADPEAAWALAAWILSLVLGATVVGLLIVEQRRLQRGIASAPALEDRVRFPAEVAGADASQLQLGRTSVVLWAGCRLSRCRGPTLPAGVVRCRIGPDQTLFVDARARTQLTFETSELLPDEHARAALRAACDSVGIRVEETAEPLTGQGALLVPHGWTYDAQLPPDAHLTPAQDGAITSLTPLWTALALTAQLMGGVALAVHHGGGATALLVATALEAAALLWTHLTFRRSRRRVLRANPRHVAAPRLDLWRSRIGGPGGATIAYKQEPGP